MSAVSNPTDPFVHLQNQLDELHGLIEGLLTNATTDESALTDFRRSFQTVTGQVKSIYERSEILATAQADAIVYSAQVIHELEETKLSLSEARGAAEEAAQDTQRLSDTIFERSHDGVLVLNDRKCIACNDNALRLLGLSREDVMQRWPFPEDTTSHTQHGTTLWDELDKNSESVLSHEVEYCHPDGRRVWCGVSLSGFDMKSHRHMLMIVRDITARKQFESELQRNRDFLNNIINAIPDQVYVRTEDHRFVIANDSLCRTHGISRDQIVGTTPGQTLPTEIATTLLDADDALLETGSQNELQQEFATSEGERRTVAIRQSLFDDSSRGERYIVGTARDITEERRRENRLTLLASVFDSAGEGILILTREGIISESNLQFGEMVGRTVVELEGEDFAHSLGPDFESLREHFPTVAEGEQWSGSIKVEIQGKTRWLWVSLSPADHEGGLETQRIIGLFSDVTILKGTQRRLRHQANHDNLTGLPNRRYFRQFVEAKIQKAQEQDFRFAVCFLDLDDFKNVNDTSGHDVGDQLLCAVADSVKKTLRPHDFFARFGGDEFAVVLCDIGQDSVSAAKTCQKILGALSNPFMLDNGEATIGVSIGVTIFPQHASHTDALMQNADIAMYAAKAAGKNQVRFFSPEMQSLVAKRHQVLTELRAAVHNGEIHLFYQPKICAKTGIPVGCEALARWNKDGDKAVRPDLFIELAEQNGLIVELGQHLFREAAVQCCRWVKMGLSPVPLAVNISPRQLRHPDFVRQLREILDETGAKAEWFELELTENAIVENILHAIETINELTALGFKVALDDFGTGYSSLSYLKSFPIHTLKIDISFIRDVTVDSKTKAIVSAIIALGRGLGLVTVAEGVEKPEQLEWLATSGCDLIQGFYISMPLTAEDFESWMRAKLPCEDRHPRALEGI